MTVITPLCAESTLPRDACLARTLLIAVLCSATAGCGVLAAPCRITSAALKMVPLVGHVAALPTDGCAAVID